MKRLKITIISMTLATTAIAQGVMDVHSHLITPEFASSLEKEGRLMDEGFPLPKYDVYNHLKWMDEAGVETSVLTLAAPQPTSAQTVRQTNEAAARIKKEHPERFMFCAALPLPDVSKAIEEAKYALDVLKADGIKLATNVDGQYLGAPELDTLFSVLNERKAVVILHPHRPEPVNKQVMQQTPLAMQEYLSKEPDLAPFKEMILWKNAKWLFEQTGEKPAAAMLMVSAAVMAQQASKVYLTREISPESLVKIYKALGVEAKGRVAVKMSTGEGSNPNYLKPELVKNLIWEVDGTIVECNTAYGNGPSDKKDERNTSENHWKVIERHGFTKFFPVDIMDEYDEIRIPVKDQTHIKYDIVGGHMANYDFMIALNHFKGHPMGGYGGALKNLSIGCASQNGKAYIHSAGKMEKLDMGKLWTPEFIGNQDGFLESMAAAAQAVVNYFNKKQGIIYISVMNNMSIDCDCVDHPEPVKLEDYGILASTDPVALDQACIDIINQQKVTAKNDPTDLLKRIDKQHGTHTIDHAAQIGLGSKMYELVNLDL